MNEPIVLDNSKRSVLRQCKMKYFLQVVKGLQSNYGSTAIRYGVGYHGIQEGYHSWVREHGWPKPETEMAAITAGLLKGKEKWDKESQTKTFFEDYKNFNTLVEHFNAYLIEFAEDREFMEILATETKFECPILPESEAERKLLSKLPPISFTGRIDLIVSMGGQVWIFDFKTTGWILSQVVSKANRSPQLIGYSYAGEHCLDFKPNGCLASFAYVGATKRKDETYSVPRFEFRRVPQIFTDEDIAAWKMQFIDACREVDFATREDLWVESFDNCYMYGACPYLKLCLQHRPYEELNLEGFHQEWWDVLSEE